MDVRCTAAVMPRENCDELGVAFRTRLLNATEECFVLKEDSLALIDY